MKKPRLVHEAGSGTGNDSGDNVQDKASHRHTYENLNLVELTTDEHDIFLIGFTCGWLEAKSKGDAELDAMRARFNASYNQAIAELALERIANQRWRDTFNRWPYKGGQR